MSTEISVGEKTYRVRKLDPRQQFHLSRKLAPILLALGKSASVIPEEKPDAGEAAPETRSEGILQVARVMEPIAEALAAMEEKEVDYVLNMCMSVCDLRQGDSYARMITAKGDLMFDNMEMKDMIQLTMKVIEVNLGNFFGTPSGQ